MWHRPTFITCWMCTRSVWMCAQPSVKSDLISEGSRGHTKACLGELTSSHVIWWRQIFFSRDNHWHIFSFFSLAPPLTQSKPHFSSQWTESQACQDRNSAVAVFDSFLSKTERWELQQIKSALFLFSVSYLWRTGRSWERTVARRMEAALQTIKPAGPGARTVCPTTFSLCLLTKEKRSPVAQTHTKIKQFPTNLQTKISLVPFRFWFMGMF